MSVETLMLGANAVRTAQDYVKLRGYNSLPEVDGAGRPQEYLDEEEFWLDAIGPASTLREGSRIVLRKFLLSHWVPRVPGLYWKGTSGQLRASACAHIIQPDSEEDFVLYAPAGKTLQILGGVGNVRLSPSVSGQVVCASSSGEYWCGIPILIRPEAWQSLGEIQSGLRADVTGVWTAMPRDATQGLGGEEGIPRCCLVVNRSDDIQFLRESKDGYSSAWTLFERRDRYTNLLNYDFAYCVFRVSSKSATPAGYFNNDKDAAGWLQEYVNRYQGQVLTDYDEREVHFDAALPINELMSNEVDPGVIRAFVARVKRGALSPDTVRYDALPQILVSKFNNEELRELVLDCLQLDLENIVGTAAGKADVVTALMTFCEEQNSLPELVAGIVQMRPDLSKQLAA